jgi:hypothetical protein
MLELTFIVKLVGYQRFVILCHFSLKECHGLDCKDARTPLVLLQELVAP